MESIPTPSLTQLMPVRDGHWSPMITHTLCYIPSATLSHLRIHLTNQEKYKQKYRNILSVIFRDIYYLNIKKYSLICSLNFIWRTVMRLLRPWIWLIGKRCRVQPECLLMLMQYDRLLQVFQMSQLVESYPKGKGELLRNMDILRWDTGHSSSACQCIDDLLQVFALTQQPKSCP